MSCFCQLWSQNCDRIAKINCCEGMITKLWQNCKKFLSWRKDSTPITANVRWPHKVWWWPLSERKTETKSQIYQTIFCMDSKHIKYRVLKIKRYAMVPYALRSSVFLIFKSWNLGAPSLTSSQVYIIDDLSI